MDRLQVARKAHDLTLRLYEVTGCFPSEERFGLTAQLRRSAVSVGSNIAEGDGSESNRVFAKHLSIALGSLNEANYQLLVARDLGWVEPGAFTTREALLAEVRAMLLGLIASVRTRPQYKH